MRTSLSSFIYLNYTLYEAIQRISIAGYDAIDIWGGRPHAYRHDLREHEIRNLRNLIDDLGLRVASFVPAQIRYPTSLCSPIKNIRRDSLRYIKDSIETAGRFNAPVVTISPGHTLHNQNLDDGWNRLADSLIKICEFAADYEVLVAIQPKDEYQTDLINTSIQAMDMIDQCDCDNLGVLFDTGHISVMKENTQSVFEHVGDRIFHVCINDNDGNRESRLVPGHGKYNFQDLKSVLRTTGYEGYLSGNLGWLYTIDPDPAAVETREFLETLTNF